MGSMRPQPVMLPRSNDDTRRHIGTPHQYVENKRFLHCFRHGFVSNSAESLRDFRGADIEALRPTIAVKN